MKKYTKLLFERLIEKSGLNQKEFGNENEIAEKDISRYLTGEIKRGIGFEKAMQLAQKYQIDLNGMLNAKKWE